MTRLGDKEVISACVYVMTLRNSVTPYLQGGKLNQTRTPVRE